MRWTIGGLLEEMEELTNLATVAMTSKLREIRQCHALIASCLCQTVIHTPGA